LSEPSPSSKSASPSNLWTKAITATKLPFLRKKSKNPVLLFLEELLEAELLHPHQQVQAPLELRLEVPPQSDLSEAEAAAVEVVVDLVAEAVIMVVAMAHLLTEDMELPIPMDLVVVIMAHAAEPEVAVEVAVEVRDVAVDVSKISPPSLS